MIIAWTVVFDDGTRPYGSDIAIDQRRPLRLAVGETTEIRVEIVNPVGGLVVLAPGDFLQIDLRSGGYPTRQLLTARSTPMSANRHKISIAADDTKTLAPQPGSYDLWAIRGAARSCLIPLSEMRLAASALGRNYL